MTLLELLVAGAIFTIVMGGVGAVYMSTRRALDVSSAQAFVQEQGTLLQEIIARELRPAMAFGFASTGGTCGSVTATGASMLYRITEEAASRDPLTPKSVYRCMFQRTDGTEPAPFNSVPQFFVCNVSDPAVGSSTIASVLASGTACVSGTKRNLTRSAQTLHSSSRRLGVRMAVAGPEALLRVENTQFQASVTALPGTYSADIRFDLTDGSLFRIYGVGSNDPVGLRFGFTATFRN